MSRPTPPPTRSRSAASRPPGRGTPQAQPPEAPSSPPKGARQLRDRLVEQLRRLQVEVHEALGPAEARAAVVAIARRHAGPGRPVLLWDDELLERLGLRAALQEAGLETVVWPAGERPGPEPPAAWLREVAASASVGVTSVDFAVAATGTLALASGPGRGRSVSLLPWVHVAVLEASRVVATLEELFARLDRWVDPAPGGERPVAAPQPAGRPTALPSSIALITGPSRSADIENDLSIGVHGPGELHVVWLEDLTRIIPGEGASEPADRRLGGVGGAGGAGEADQLP